MAANRIMVQVRSKIDEFFELTEQHWIITLAALGLLGAAAGGWYTYRHFEIKKEEQAHTILADCLSHYEQAQQGKAPWADVISMCQLGYQKFEKTRVAPYIIAVEVDALLAEHKQQEALERLTSVLERIGTSSPFYSLYKIKQAVLQLDMADVAVQQKGLHDLQMLAADTKNPFNDQAAYYVGLYYRSQGDTQKAVDAWKPLVELNQKYTDLHERSPWAALAQEKMNGLS
jgi:tetratricopeptide (TPR) repeat protein